MQFPRSHQKQALVLFISLIVKDVLVIVVLSWEPGCTDEANGGPKHRWPLSWPKRSFFFMFQWVSGIKNMKGTKLPVASIYGYQSRIISSVRIQIWIFACIVSREAVILQLFKYVFICFRHFKILFVDRCCISNKSRGRFALANLPRVSDRAKFDAW